MNLEKIEITPNPNGDSRTASKIPSFEEFEEANRLHRADVCIMMRNIGDMITMTGLLHDWSKNDKPALSQLFYRDLVSTMNGDIKFEDGDWSKIHYGLERHHLNRRVPDDVNLIDVLEMICDCVCAGMARSGEVRDINLKGDILEKAFKNTVAMCKESVELTYDYKI